MSRDGRVFLLKLGILAYEISLESQLVRLHSPNCLECHRVEREDISPGIPGHRRLECRDVDQGCGDLERQDSDDSPLPVKVDLDMCGETVPSLVLKVDPKSKGLRLSCRQVLLGGAAVLIILALFHLFMDRGEPKPAPQSSFSAGTHTSMPVIDVIVIGDSSVAVTNLGGLTPEQVRTYLSALRKAGANNSLATVGIPTPSTSTGYEKGVVYLIDGHPTTDLLGQFVRKEAPGYSMIASTVRGPYRWPQIV